MDNEALAMTEIGGAQSASLQTTASSGSVAIETKNLNLWYGDFQALFDVDLQINQGQKKIIIVTYNI